MNYYCTLFDIRYLSRGLALYESLLNAKTSFHLVIFPFCDRSLKILQKLNLEHATLVSLKEFETPDLLKVKKDRTQGEYCWTCTPAIIQYTLEHFDCQSCTYLDADLYFFSDPSLLIEEMKDDAVLLTEHRYTPKYDHSKVSGIYCVQFMCFKANEAGYKALSWWKEKCLEWCYAHVEPDRFGDQKYLDDWTQRFEKVHVLEHLGGGLAPWNVQQYKFSNESNKLIGKTKSGHTFNAVFYHFHQLQFLSEKRIDLGGYQLEKSVVEHIYKPYIKHLMTIEERLKPLLHDEDIHGKVDKKQRFVAKLRRMLLGCDNIYPQSRLEHG